MKTDYNLLIQQAEALTKDCPHRIANLANISALLYTTLEDINWAGFYFIENAVPGFSGSLSTSLEEGSINKEGPVSPAKKGQTSESAFPDAAKLILGPFQGNPACIEIPLGKGVCGTAAAKDETQLVPDVHLFPGHITCDSASRSEIVVPIHKANRAIGVLDIDSPSPTRFTEEDKEGLEQLVRVLERTIIF